MKLGMPCLGCEKPMKVGQEVVEIIRGKLNVDGTIEFDEVIQCHKACEID